MCAASCAGDRSSATSMSPPARIGWGPLAAAGQRPDAGRDGAAHVGETLRLSVCRAQDDRRWLGPRGVASAEVGPAVGQDARVGTAERLDRSVRVADQDQVRPGRREHPQQPRGGEGEPWASSTTTSRTCAPTLAKASASSSSLVGGGGEDPGRVVGAGPGERGDLVVLAEHLRGGDPLGPAMFNTDGREPVGLDPVLDGPHEQVARPRRGSPRLPRATRTCSGQGGCGASPRA